MKTFIILLITFFIPLSCAGQQVELSLVPSHSTLDVEMIVGWMIELKDLNEDSTDLGTLLKPAEFTSTDPTLQFFRNKIEVVQLLTSSTTVLFALSLSCDNMGPIKDLIFIYDNILRDDMIEAKMYSSIVEEHSYLAITATIIISSTYSTFHKMAQELKLYESELLTRK